MALKNQYQFASEISKLRSNVWDRMFLIPKDVGNIIMQDWGKRVICTLNQSAVWHAGLMPSGDGRYFINVNKEVRKKLGIDIGSQVSVLLEKDESKYGMPVPDEFEAAMELDPEASLIFEQLTPGKQRSILFILGKPKSSEIRIKKSITFLNYIKDVQGKLDFKELNQAFKDANR